MNKKVLTIFVCLTILIGLTACGKKEEKDDYDLTGTFDYRYKAGDPLIVDDLVEIDYEKKRIKVNDKHFCTPDSPKDCVPTDRNYVATVSSERMKKIHKIIENLDFKDETKNEEEKGTLVTIFIYLSKEEDKVLIKREDDENAFDNYYKESDLNDDGQVTYHETADFGLDRIINDLGI